MNEKLNLKIIFNFHLSMKSNAYYIFIEKPLLIRYSFPHIKTTTKMKSELMTFLEEDWHWSSVPVLS